MKEVLLTHASLFSGIGGAEVAAEMLGWENLFHCEINPFGRAVLEYWFPNSVSYEDITKTDFTPWRGRLDVLTGGFPCQPFSYAGKRRGANDDRYLWPQMCRAISETRPTWVIGENVAGLATMVEQGTVAEVGVQTALFGEADTLRSYEQSERFTIERICADLEAIGYAVQPVLIPACAVGAPHRRDRIFIIGFNTDTDGIGGREVHEHMESDRAERHESVSDGGQRDVTVTALHRLEYMLPTWGRRNESEGDDRAEFGRGARWQGFPTVSAVLRGNDGLSFDVDDLTIPFARWRTESLKAYGNAIVPQVMYEIFRAIESVETHSCDG